MHHPAELALHSYLEKACRGESSMSEDTINQIATDVSKALQRQFGGGNKRNNFKLRMSNVGRPACQLWYEKNKPEKALPPPNTFVMNMMLGDIVEAVFKGLLKEAKVDYEDSNEVELKLDESTTVSGTYDIVVDDAVDDIKSASKWSYENKFRSFESLKEHDGFGYIGQLAGYAKASGKKPGGWWVVNKANGQFKYLPAEGIDIEEEVSNISNTANKLRDNKFERCFEPEPETFRGALTGNKILNDNCRFCSFRFDCWPSLKEVPSVVSKAREPKMVQYVHMIEE